MTAEQAAARQAAHENLIRELVEALESYIGAIHYAQDKQAIMAAIKAADDRARTVLAKVRGQA